jgi:HD superfamily phosphohydrolase YqeK
MDKLAKIIYIADKTEENRKFEGVETLRKIAMQNLDEAVLTILNYDIKKNIDKGRIIHIDSIHTRNHLLS